MSVVGVDIGTSSCKAMAFSTDGRILGASAESYSRITHSGNCEILPTDLIFALDSVLSSLASVTSDDPIQAISFSVFGGSFIPLDAQMQPLGNLISTTDDRGLPDSISWTETFTIPRTYGITGLVPHPSFLLIKAMAFRRLNPDIFEKVALLASAEEFILTHLGLKPVVDSSTASTYMAYDLNKGDWSDEILGAACISRSLLAPVVTSGTVVGRIGSSVAQRLGLPEGIVVVAGGHDQQVAAFGAGLTAPGSVTDSLGTVEAMSCVLESSQLSETFMNNNLPNLCHVYGGLFFTMVYNFSCADLLNWAARAFYGAQPGEELEMLKRGLDEMPDTPSALLVQPHFSGSGTPHMDPSSRGAILGLNLSTTRQDIMRAIIDCQNYEMRLNIDIWRELGIHIDQIRVFGGLAQNDRILQIKADILGVDVVRLECGESGCLGAAALAASGAGLVSDPLDFLRTNVRESGVFAPRREFGARHDEMYALYRQLYDEVKDLHHKMAQ